jgi:hypothetical protein
MVGIGVAQVADIGVEFRFLPLGMAALFAFLGVCASTVLPPSAQIFTALTPSQASDLTAPMAAGVRSTGIQAAAVESVISATTILASHGYPAAQASVLRAVVSASATAGTTADVIGTGVGQAVAILAWNPATQSHAVSLAAAAPSVLNTAELAAFKAATTAITINAQRSVAKVAALGTQAEQITAAIPGTAGAIYAFPGGGLPPGAGFCRCSGMHSDSIRDALLSPSWF